MTNGLPRILALSIGSLLTVVGLSCGGGGEDLEEVTLVAESQIEAPDFFVEVEGDFAAPDSNAFSTRAGFGMLTLEQEVIVIGERAWVRLGDEWDETDIDDPDLEGSLELSVGGTKFWSDFDTSRLAAFSGPREIFNGVEAQRISLTGEDIQLLARFFNAEEEELESLEEFEFTIWLAEEGGWLVGMRAVFVAGEDFFSDDEEEEEEAIAADNIPPKLLNSFHYALVVAAKTEPGEGSDEDQLRLELVMAISRVNDESITITAPQ